MKPSYESAVAKFLEDGGRVSRVAESIDVTEPELLRYLENSGNAVTHEPEGRSYWCGGERLSLQGLVALANHHRSLAGLPPFALRTVMRPGGARPSSS